MHFVYIIESIVHKRKYIGSTSNVNKRLLKHNAGGNKSTKPFKPYKLIYQESFESKFEAIRREKQLKSYKGGKALLKLISCWDGGAVNHIRL